MILEPHEVRLITNALRMYRNTAEGIPGTTPLIDKLVKFSDGGEVGAIDPAARHDNMVNDEADYTTFVVGKASKQTMRGEDLPPGMSLDPFHAQLLTGLLGSVGELGELADHIKKYMFHGHVEHPLDMEYILLEQGDRRWYDTMLNYAFKLLPLDIITANVYKLNARYKKALTPDESANRVEGHPEVIHQTRLSAALCTSTQQSATAPIRRQYAKDHAGTHSGMLSEGGKHYQFEWGDAATGSQPNINGVRPSQCEASVLRDPHAPAGGYVRCALPYLHGGNHASRLGQPK